MLAAELVGFNCSKILKNNYVLSKARNLFMVKRVCVRLFVWKFICKLANQLWLTMQKCFSGLKMQLECLFSLTSN